MLPSSLKLQIMLRWEATLHIIHSCPLSSIEVQVIILQSKSLFCNAFKMNQTRMCEMERPIHYSYLHNTRKKDFSFTLIIFLHNFFFCYSPPHILCKLTEREHCVLKCLDLWPCVWAAIEDEEAWLMPTRHTTTPPSLTSFKQCTSFEYIIHTINLLIIVMERRLGNSYFYIAHIDALFFVHFQVSREWQ